MLQNLLSTSIFLLISCWTFSQDCPEINAPVLVFQTQADIQSFADDYPNCTQLNTDILITGSVEDLGPLSFLEKVIGRLNIRNADLLTNLSGLENLIEVQGLFDIDGNDAITDLSALNNLRTVGNLDIRSNKSLHSIVGFSSLTQVEGFLSFFNNNEITEINAFPNLDTIGGDLKIFREQNLLSVSGFDKLSYIGGDLMIDAVGALSLIHGFDQLKKIDKSIKITTNNLQSLSGFSALDTIAGSLHLICFPSSYAVSGFSNLKYIHQNLLFDRGLGQLAGFEQLNWIGGAFDITTSDGLVTVPDFPNLDTIGGHFVLFNNPDLEHAPRFPALQHIGNNISITQNKALRQIGTFQDIQKINGNLDISRNDSLTQLSAFHSLDTIIGYLKLERNNALSSLDGLEDMDYIGTSFSLDNCLSIENINALQDIDHIGGSLMLVGNRELQSLLGLNRIKSLQALRIESNYALQDLSGLESLTEVKSLSISYNRELKNVEALNSLIAITEGELSIRENRELINLKGLENLQHLQGGIYITNNDRLQSISALDSLETDHISLLSIRSNRNLRYCNAPGICDFLANSSQPRTIEGNASGCDNEIEILRYCSDFLPTVAGKVYLDQNCNMEQDSLDTLVPEIILLNAVTEAPFTLTDSNGHYLRSLPFDSIVQYKLRSIDNFVSMPEHHIVHTPDTIVLYSDLDFSLCPTAIIRDLNVDLISLSPPRPGFVHEYMLCVENIGTTPEVADIDFSFVGMNNEEWIDSLFIDGNPVMASNPSWTSPPIAPFARSCFEISTYLTPDEAILGEILRPKVVVGLVDQLDSNPSDNMDSLDLVIVGSYDPNDKQVSVDSLNFEELEDPLYLEYTIRFQNTGTFSAEFIEITDSIGDYLDLSSFTMLSSSHHYQLEFKAHRQLSWFFPDIQLPPSSEDEVASNGYIKFGIKTKPGLKLDDVLTNRAYIYFDFNNPIITKDATTQFFTITSLSDPVAQMINSRIYPNPAQEHVTIDMAGPIRGTEVGFRLFSIDGQLLEKRTLVINGQTLWTFPTGHLPSGSYLIQLHMDGQRTVHKMIK